MDSNPRNQIFRKMLLGGSTPRLGHLFDQWRGILKYKCFFIFAKFGGEMDWGDLMKSRRRRLFAILRGGMDGGDLLMPPAAVVGHFQGLCRLDQGDQNSWFDFHELEAIVWNLKPGSTPLKPSTSVLQLISLICVFILIFGSRRSGRVHSPNSSSSRILEF